MAFPIICGGINNYAVEVKATEQPVPPRFSVKTTVYERLANSNIPALLIVVNVKQNRLYYAWLTPKAAEESPKMHMIKIPVTEVDEGVKEKLRQQLAGEQAFRGVQAAVLSGN